MFFFSLFSPSKIYEASYLSYSITQIVKHKYTHTIWKN